MPKAEKGSAKHLANKMKSKGLQKLKWYCQVCEKQCRDDNGFKCHMMSESHLRQMLVVGESAGKHISDYSQSFQREFLVLLSRRWGTKRVRANQVYQEYIQDKDHLHMNSTRWVSLTEFIKYLGRAGIVHVDETEKGFFISWIDNSPQALSKQASNQVKERADMDDEQRQRKHIAEQIERARILEEEKAAKAQEKSGSSEEENKSAREERKPTGPISISIGGLKKDSPPVASVESLKPVEASPSAEAPQDPVEAPVEPVASTSVLPAPAAPAPLKLNAFKKTNPLKVNPLKAPKAPASEKKSTQHSLTAVEQLMKEDQERKRRREMGDSRERYGPALKRARA